MTTYQTQTNAYTAYKVQSAKGSQASGSSARILRQSGGAGGKLTKSATESGEISHDMMSTRGRHGSQKTAGSYSSELSLGLMDNILEAVMRGTYETALTKTQADFTSITTGAHTIVLTSGNPVTMGFRVGDVIRVSGHATTANNSRNLRITGLSSTTITVAETLVVDAVADTSVSISRVGQKLINPAAGSLVKRYFTIEEYEEDIDESEVFTDCYWGGVKFAMQPNGLIMVDTNWVGTGQFERVESGSAPLFSSPTVPTGVPMAVVDATIRMGGSDLVDLTSFELTIDTNPEATDVIASHYGADVFPGQVMVGMNLTALRSDLARVADFLNETVLSLHVLAVDNESEPKDFVSIYVPNFTLGSVDKSALGKSGGARTQTFAIPPALVGRDDTGSGYDATMVKIQVSNS